MNLNKNISPFKPTRTCAMCGRELQQGIFYPEFCCDEDCLNMFNALRSNPETAYMQARIQSFIKNKMHSQEILLQSKYELPYHVRKHGRTPKEVFDKLSADFWERHIRCNDLEFELMQTKGYRKSAEKRVQELENALAQTEAKLSIAQEKVIGLEVALENKLQLTENQFKQVYQKLLEGVNPNNRPDDPYAATMLSILEQNELWLRNLLTGSIL